MSGYCDECGNTLCICPVGEDESVPLEVQLEVMQNQLEAERAGHRVFMDRQIATFKRLVREKQALRAERDVLQSRVDVLEEGLLATGLATRVRDNESGWELFGPVHPFEGDPEGLCVRRFGGCRCAVPAGAALHYVA